MKRVKTVSKLLTLVFLAASASPIGAMEEKGAIGRFLDYIGITGSVSEEEEEELFEARVRRHETKEEFTRRFTAGRDAMLRRIKLREESLEEAAEEPEEVELSAEVLEEMERGLLKMAHKTGEKIQGKIHQAPTRHLPFQISQNVRVIDSG
ncbi:hypothetical protein IIB79_01590 [candidate division KSB1 bacterium]|nr:hypothetical protein [candidate division KSB1 bacterium]